ncbi:MAG: hypothetical protein M1605_03650 [Candidatus Thermoplasmatota archaeon]|nr:hypothetical protein [Candidatus Thermoplasmatota archaeon]
MYSLQALAFAILSFLLLWIIISIPVYLASKFVVPRKSTFGKAMIAAIGALIAFTVLSLLVGIVLPLLSLLAGLIGILFVFKAMYETDWINAFVMGIMVLVFIVIILFVLAAVGIVGALINFHHLSGI